MKSVSGLVYLVVLDLRRQFRNLRFLLFVILPPILFYILYTKAAQASGTIGDVNWNAYSLVSMMAFGIIMNSISLLGVRIAAEKKRKWYNYLKVSPVNDRLYEISQFTSYVIISVIFLLFMFLLARLLNGVALSFAQMIGIMLSLLIGSFVFLAVALIVGELAEIAQPVGTTLYLLLSLMGGLWMPVITMPSLMRRIAVYLPSYIFADNGWRVLSRSAVSLMNWVALGLWLVLFLLIYLVVSNGKKRLSTFMFKK